MGKANEDLCLLELAREGKEREEHASKRVKGRTILLELINCKFLSFGIIGVKHRRLNFS